MPSSFKRGVTKRPVAQEQPKGEPQENKATPSVQTQEVKPAETESNTATLSSQPTKNVEPKTVATPSPTRPSRSGLVARTTVTINEEDAQTLNAILMASGQYKYMYELLHDLADRAASNLTSEERKIYDAKKALDQMRKSK